MLFSRYMDKLKVVVTQFLKPMHLTAVEVLGFLVILKIVMVHIDDSLVSCASQVGSPFPTGFDYCKQFFVIHIPVLLGFV